MRRPKRRGHFTYWARILLPTAAVCLLFRFPPGPQPEEDELIFTSKLQYKSKGEGLSSSDSSPFAYASIIGGVHPEKPSYRGMLYNILVASRILRLAGSTADVVLFIQMSFDCNEEELPKEDVRLLDALQVQMEYIPKSRYQSFYEITLEKFRILELTQYQRVIFMDADVMPIHNLDYLFQLSTEGGFLQENLVLAGKQEPSNAGFFMLTPGKGELDKLRKVIAIREERAKDLPYPKFDIVMGWGHKIEPPDQWETLRESRRGTTWTFYSADADQGLLYEWTKYVKQRVSIVIGTRVQTWVTSGTSYPHLKETLERPFRNFSFRLAPWAEGAPPYQHFIHFTGRTKPWEGPIPSDLSFSTRTESPEKFWFYHLLQINQELGILDARNWEVERVKWSNPPLGRFHVKDDMVQRVNRTNYVRRLN